MKYPDDGPPDHAKAKARAEEVHNDPKHHREKGSPEDLATIDDNLQDPAKQKKDND